MLNASNGFLWNTFNSLVVGMRYTNKIALALYNHRHLLEAAEQLSSSSRGLRVN